MAVPQRFVAPYPQEVLGGELGLTSLDIAQALKVNHWAITEKLHRLDRKALSKHGFIFNVDTLKMTKGRGRPTTVYFMNVSAAKFVVAKWDNEAGWAYLAYLLECERFVMEGIPKLKAELEKVLAEREAYRRAAHVKRAKGRRSFIESHTVINKDVFGELHAEVIWDHVPWDEMTAGQRKQARLSRNASILRGISQSMERDVNEEKIKKLEQLKSRGQKPRTTERPEL